MPATRWGRTMWEAACWGSERRSTPDANVGAVTAVKALACAALATAEPVACDSATFTSESSDLSACRAGVPQSTQSTSPVRNCAPQNLQNANAIPPRGSLFKQLPAPAANIAHSETRQTVVLQVSNADKFVAERLSGNLRLPSNRRGCR